PLLLHPFPTRRSSDLDYMSAGQEPAGTTKPSDIESDDGQLRFSAAEIDQLVDRFPFIRVRAQLRALLRWDELEQYPSPVRKKDIDRKSTRLNSSHGSI